MKKILLRILLSLCLSGGVVNVYAENIIGPKLGYVSWGQDTATIGGQEITFRGENIRPVGVEYNFVFENGLSLGGEFLYQELGVKNSSTGSANVYRYMVVSKYFFPEMGNVRPFIGVGVGRAQISIHGTESEPNARLSGPVYTQNAGVEFEFGDRMGLGLEFRRAHLRMRDDNDEMSSRNNELLFQLDRICFNNDLIGFVS